MPKPRSMYDLQASMRWTPSAASLIASAR